MNVSYWDQCSFLEEQDLIIIGSGIVGLQSAIHLKQKFPLLKISILERGSIPWGASTRNAGFACFGSLTELISDVETQGWDKTLSLVEKRYKGLQALRNQLGDFSIGFQECGGFEVFKEKDQTSFEAAAEKIHLYNTTLSQIISSTSNFNLNHSKARESGLNFKWAIENKAEGLLHTGKMMQQLLQLSRQLQIQIYNGIEVNHIEEKETLIHIQSSSLHFKTKKILFCTNGFSHTLLPNYDIQAARNQVLITEPISNLDLNGGFHYDEGYIYFRNVDSRILLGGGRNHFPQTEYTAVMENTEELKTYLQEFLFENIIPNHKEVKIAGFWSGILGIGKTKEPIVERKCKNQYIATRMGGMGVALGILTGQEAAELISLDL